MKNILIFSALHVLTATTLCAETPLSKLPANKLIDLCIHTQAEGEDAESFALELEDRKSMDLNGGAIIDGTNCLTREFDEIYRYKEGRFYNWQSPRKISRLQAKRNAEQSKIDAVLRAEQKEVEAKRKADRKRIKAERQAAADARRAAAEAYWVAEARWQDRQRRIAQQKRERAFEEAIVSVCRLEYQKDRFRALTTPACRQVFIARGLP